MKSGSLSYPFEVRGFTLIEVLIAMTLLSLMVVVLFASLKVCADSWEKGENKITQVNDVAVVYNFFQQHLATTRPFMKNWSKDTQPSLSFQGKGQSLQFVSSFPASAGRSGLQLFTISLKNEDNESVINVALTPFFPIDEGRAQKEEVLLIKGVKDFSLAYFGSDDGIAPGSWRGEWLDKAFLPRLVRIIIKLDSQMYLPEMIIDLKITGAANQQNTGLGIPQGNPFQ